MARLGAMVTPYVAQVALKDKQYFCDLQTKLLQVLLKSSIAVAISVYSTAALLAAIACVVLPIETSGKELTDNVQQHANANAKWNLKKYYQ